MLFIDKIMLLQHISMRQYYFSFLGQNIIVLTYDFQPWI